MAEVTITVHTDNGKLVGVSPNPCPVQAGDTITWRICDPDNSHVLHIGNFRESLTGKAANPVKPADHDLDTEAKSDVQNVAKMNYTYTVRLVHRAKLIDSARQYLKKKPLVGPAVTAKKKMASAAQEAYAVTAAGFEFDQLFQTEDEFLGFAMSMQFMSYSDAEMNPEIQVGGTAG